VRVGERTIGVDHPPYIIAELGVNHDGSRERGAALVDAARAAGADAIKLQFFEAERLLSRAARPAAYQRRGGAEDPMSMLLDLQLDLDALTELADRARGLGMDPLVTVFSHELVAAAESGPWTAYKVASTDLVNLPLLAALVATGRPLLLSTGAASMEEIDRAVAAVGAQPHLLMQCVSCYPTPESSAHLAGIGVLQRRHPQALGYSDHTTALDTGALAVAAGARVLEKHLTLDRAAPGPDHAASVDPAGLAEYVRLAHRADAMLGPPVKDVLAIERDVREASRQSIVSRRDLPIDHVIAAADLSIKRPGTGLAPERLAATIGRRVARPVPADTPLREDDLA
jgi:sialic acid synthase SpsE